MPVKMVASVTVYAIINPINGKVFYIGITAGSLEERLEQHLKKAGNPKMAKAVDRILGKGLKPLIVKLQKCRGNDRACVRERYWVNYYYNKGFKLCNGNLIDAKLIVRDNYSYPKKAARLKPEYQKK